MPAEIAFTDGVGYATLPALGGGFSNWVPDPFDLDDAAERLGSGQVDAFLMRARDGFSFELLLLNTDLPVAQRLIRHLWRGGLCSVDTGSLNVVTPTVYLNMGIATTEDGERIAPTLERFDRETVDYRLAVHLEGASASGPTALSVWYLRHLTSDADLTTMAEQPPKLDPTGIPSLDPGETWETALVVELDVVGSGGPVPWDSLNDIEQLSHTIKPTPSTGARMLLSRIGAAAGQNHFTDALARFATPALAAQTVTPFTAILNFHDWIGAEIEHGTWFYAWLVQWRPGVGVIVAYDTLDADVDLTGVGNDIGVSEAFVAMRIPVVTTLDIQDGDRIVLEVQGIHFDGSIIAGHPGFVYDGASETIPGSGASFDYAANIEMPDFVLA